MSAVQVSISHALRLYEKWEYYFSSELVRAYKTDMQQQQGAELEFSIETTKKGIERSPKLLNANLLPGKGVNIIYAIEINNTIEYVGMTQNCQHRIISHFCNWISRYATKDKKNKIKVCFIDADGFDMSIYILERVFISKYKPSKNIADKNDWYSKICLKKETVAPIALQVSQLPIPKNPDSFKNIIIEVWDCFVIIYYTCMSGAVPSYEHSKKQYFDFSYNNLNSMFYLSASAYTWFLSYLVHLGYIQPCPQKDGYYCISAPIVKKINSAIPRYK
jgi:hypothetical protein